MPFPTVDELDAAYAEGEAAPPGTKNPYFYATPLHMQWNYGHRDGALYRPFAAENRFSLVIRCMVYASLATMAVSFVLHTLL